MAIIKLKLSISGWFCFLEEMFIIRALFNSTSFPNQLYFRFRYVFVFKNLEINTFFRCLVKILRPRRKHKHWYVLRKTEMLCKCRENKFQFNFKKIFHRTVRKPQSEFMRTEGRHAAWNYPSPPDSPTMKTIFGNCGFEDFLTPIWGDGGFQLHFSAWKLAACCRGRL